MADFAEVYADVSAGDRALLASAAAAGRVPVAEG